MKWYTELIQYALDNRLPTNLLYYNKKPYEGMIAIRIDGIVFGPFAWEMFEDIIEGEDEKRVKWLKQRVERKR